jgi:uncharacterized protein YutE (UPF0331/DUF86 family)
MVDKDLVMAKAGLIRKHLKRVELKCNVELPAFLADIDRQESVMFNLQMAIQNCIDLAAHIISEEGLGVPGSTNEMLYLLEENGYIDSALTEKMAKAVGFRNLIVHEYAKIDLEQVLEIGKEDLQDLYHYIRSIFGKLGYQQNKNV